MSNYAFVKWIFLALMLLPPGPISAQTVATPPSDQHNTANNTPPPTITVPAGTRMLVTLKNPLHTTSAEANSGVYSETASVVVQDNRVVIPLKTQVQGVVQSEQRPGRIKGRARFLLHFDTLIFANNYAVPIDAALLGVPGSNQVRNKKGKGIEPVDQIDKDLGRIFAPTLGGAAIGSLRSLGPGTLTGAGAGALFGLGVTLFTRGDEIRLNPGTSMEIVLQSPLTLNLDRLP